MFWLTLYIFYCSIPNIHNRTHRREEKSRNATWHLSINCKTNARNNRNTLKKLCIVWITRKISGSCHGRRVRPKMKLSHNFCSCVCSQGTAPTSTYLLFVITKSEFDRVENMQEICVWKMEINMDICQHYVPSSTTPSKILQQCKVKW